jgi:hypothetical protein
MSFHRLLVTAGAAACAALALALSAPTVLGSGDSTEDGADQGSHAAAPGAPSPTGVPDGSRPTDGAAPSAGGRPSAAPGEMTTASSTASPKPGLPGLRGGRRSDATLVPDDVPTAPGSEVSTRTVSPSGDRVQVAMVASVGRGPVAVLRFYRIAFSRLGLHEVHTRPAPGSSAAAFASSTGSVVVTATPGADRTSTYSVFATLTSQGA